MCRFPLEGKIKTREMKINWQVLHCVVNFYWKLSFCGCWNLCYNLCHFIYFIVSVQIFFLFSNRNLLYKLYYKRSVTRRDYFSFSLIQAQLGCIPLQDFTLTQDTGKIFRNGIRITRCMVKFNPFFVNTV